MRIAKVVSTCFKRGRVREKTLLIGEPIGFFSHSQNFTTVKDTIHLLNFQISMEEKYPPGINRDIIIVNSDVGSEEGNLFIKKLNNKKIDNGKIITFTRENFGLSYGAYNDAFIKFKENYDYFLFVEDDLITAKKNYLKIGLDKFKENTNTGFLAYYGVSKIPKSWWKIAGLNDRNAFSAYSGCGLTSKKILNEIYHKHGCIPHNKKDINHLNSIAYGEIAFSKSFIDLNYNLIEMRNEILIIPAYDLMRNIQYKKYPNFFEKSIWIIKLKIYKFFSKFPKLLEKYLNIIKKIKNFFNK